jgi:hypothetical protein
MKKWNLANVWIKCIKEFFLDIPPPLEVWPYIARYRQRRKPPIEYYRTVYSLTIMESIECRLKKVHLLHLGPICHRWLMTSVSSHHIWPYQTHHNAWLYTGLPQHLCNCAIGIQRIQVPLLLCIWKVLGSILGRWTAYSGELSWFCSKSNSTSWTSIFDMTTVAELIMKLPAFHCNHTWKFIPVITRARHWTLQSQTKPIQFLMLFLHDAHLTFNVRMLDKSNST